MDLSHVIVAMKGDRIAKVQCNTCKKTTSIKAPKGITDPAPAPKAKKSKKAAEPEAAPIEVEWEKLMAAHKNGAAEELTP